MPCFWADKERQRTLPASADSQLAQNNLYAKVAYFRGAYFDIFQKLRCPSPEPLFLTTTL